MLATTRPLVNQCCACWRVLYEPTRRYQSEAWKPKGHRIEASHGYCPACLEEELRRYRVGHRIDA